MITLSWSPVVVVDMVGSVATFALAVWCASIAWGWTRKKTDDVFRHYIFLLTIAIVFFALSRSFGHLLKQILLVSNMGDIWKHIAPFSGAVNSITFVVIFSLCIYVHRFQKIHLQIEEYQNHLEAMIAKRTAELEETNIALEDEITERAQTAKALCESQGYLQAVLDHTPLPIYLKDLAGQYVLINKEFERLVGVSNESIVGKTDSEVFPEEIATLFAQQDADVKREQSTQVFEETVPLFDGIYTFITAKFPLFDGENMYAVGGVCTDITSRKQAEEKLAAEQERLAVTLRSIGDGVITTDTDGKIVLINKVAERLTGWVQEEALGKPIGEVFTLLTKERQPCSDLVENVMKSCQMVALDEPLVLVSKHGREFMIADSGAPILDKESAVIGVVIVFRDVTHQLQLEEESLKVKKLESIGVLAGGIAHDFNNILSAILGNISLARFDTDMMEETKILLGEAEKASLRAKDLTQQLLTFSKGGDPVKKTSSLQEIIRDSADFVLHGGKVACRYDFAEDLQLVEIDQGQISQVIQNIIINAKHAMPNGGLITVKCYNIEAGADPTLPAGKCYVCIEISDQGVGIPATIIDRIFDPYFSTKSAGNGLGLAICHSIIAKHHGVITVRSQPGEKTTFFIILPASCRKESEAAPEYARVDVAPKAKILIMDDEVMVRDVAQAILQKFGHEALVAAHGDEAIMLYRQALDSGRAIDLTIMDLTIPGGMGGKVAVQKFLEMNADAKVVVSSGYSQDPIMANYARYGFCAAIVKPYRVDELLKLIDDVLGE